MMYVALSTGPGGGMMETLGPIDVCVTLRHDSCEPWFPQLENGATGNLYLGEQL